MRAAQRHGVEVSPDPRRRAQHPEEGAERLPARALSGSALKKKSREEKKHLANLPAEPQKTVGLEPMCDDVCEANRFLAGLLRDHWNFGRRKMTTPATIERLYSPFSCWAQWWPSLQKTTRKAMQLCNVCPWRVVCILGVLQNPSGLTAIRAFGRKHGSGGPSGPGR